MMNNKRVWLGLCGVLTALALCVSAFAPPAPALASDGAPVAENLEIRTYRGVSAGGRLSAVDPEGELITYEITTQPVKGTVELEEDGRFVYTPAEGKRGRDYFGFRATDAGGRSSQEATVIIRIEKQKLKTGYADMDGSAGAYAAVILAERGVFTGQSVGGVLVFEPERGVTRGEFLAMCMAATGVETLSGVSSTGFLDDMEISRWQKPYIATALMNGAASGYEQRLGAVFKADAIITRAEAAVLLDNLMELSDVTASTLSGGAPDWAAQSVANTRACGIITDGGAFSAKLTRAEAATMLLAAMEIIAAR